MAGNSTDHQSWTSMQVRDDSDGNSWETVSAGSSIYWVTDDTGCWGRYGVVRPGPSTPGPAPSITTAEEEALRKAIVAGSIAAMFIALAIGAAAAPHEPPELSKYGSAVHGPRPAPDCRNLVPACPPRRPAHVFPYRLTDAVVDLYAPREVTDIIDPEEAEDIAWQEDSSGMGADYQVAILAAYEDGTIVWIVDYIGGCVTRSSQGVCADSASVAIDAMTGEFIASGVPGV